MSTPSKNAVTPRYRLVDTVTGQQHDVTYGSGLLCNVTNTPRGIAEDAMPGDLRGTADGERYRLLETSLVSSTQSTGPQSLLAHDGAVPNGKTGAPMSTTPTAITCEKESAT